MQDIHIHMMYGKSDSPSEFLKKTTAAGITGGAIFGLYPEGHHKVDGEDQRWQHRLEHLLSFTAQTPGFRPVFWMDPTDPDAAQQVAALAEARVSAIKVICSHFRPDEVMKIWYQIAETGLPVMFHSGILYNIENPGGSSYNRPLAFECLVKVRKLRFSLAHISWPWVDECIALFGEFNASSNGGTDGMYIDLTPGTPRVYRKDALQKLLCSAFSNGLDKIIWGTDCLVNSYDTQLAAQWLEKDQHVIREIKADPEFGEPEQKSAWEGGANSAPGESRLKDIWEKISERNIRRFFAD